MAFFSGSSAIVRAQFETARETAFGAITNSFTMIGTPFTANFSVLYVQNFTDVNIDFCISLTSLTTKFTLAPGGIISTDMISNGMQIAKGEAAWCKYRAGAPSSGFVQVTTVTPV